ncbi:MAG: CHAD domain-containing protein [Cytophagales bacterium]|nr:CHAD domain-containing protein [Armatimonadota bacterium]
MAKAVPIYKLTQTERPLRDSAPVLMVRLQEMLDYADSIRSPENVAELHNLRIAAKRLRYTLELFAPTLDPVGVSDLLDRVTEIQERIGVIHDCDVLFPLLQDTMELEMEREKRVIKKRGGVSVGPPPFLAAEGLAGMTAQKRDERVRLYAEFVAFWDALPPDRLISELSRLVAAPEESRTA